MNRAVSGIRNFDVRMRLFVSEMIAAAALMGFVLPYVVVSSRLDEQEDALQTYLMAVVLVTILVVVSSAYPITWLTRPIRKYFDQIEAGKVDSEFLLNVRARSLNLPLFFTLSVIARYAVGCTIIVAIMWASRALSGSDSMWLLLRGMLSLTPGFVFLFFICERIVQPVRQSIALQCRGLKGVGREQVHKVTLKTRIFLVSLVLMALYLTALGVTSYQQVAGLNPTTDVIRQHVGVLVWVISISMVMATIMSTLAARSISDPLARAATIMEAVGKGDLDLRVDVLTNDETANLGESFNYMVDQLQESQRQLRAANDEIRALNRGLEQKVLERTYALQVEATKNNVILQSIADGVMVFDARQSAILANKAVEQMLGLNQNEIIGRHVDEMVSKGATPEERDRSLALLTGLLLQTGEDNRATPVYLKFRLGGRTLSASLAPIAEPTSELQGGFVAVYRDITEEEAAAELSRQNRDLLEANRLKSQFLATMSHELRTPMNSIIGYCQVLERGIDGALNEEQAKDVGRIKESGRNLLTIINDILDLSKIDAGRLEIRSRVLDFAHLLTSTCSAVEPLAERKGLELRTGVQEGLPSVWADEDRLRQVLMNLLSNAIKFTREGSVRVEAHDGGGGHVQVAVVDDGVGIAPEDQSAIFDEFYQVDGSGTREFGGTGLGLAITRRLVEMMGGHIWVESTPGNGSRFTFTIPVTVEEAEKRRLNLEAEARAASEARRQAIRQSWPTLEVTLPPLLGAPSGSFPLPDRVVLVIDDDSAVLDLLARFLGEDGYQVVGARKGAEGLLRARELQPLAITLDLFLPDMNGLDVLQELKANRLTRNIPVLVVSVADTRAEGLRLGAVDHLRKPVDREELIRKVRLLDHSGERVLVLSRDAKLQNQLRQMLGESGYELQTATLEAEALEIVEKSPPQILLLDMSSDPRWGLDLLHRLKRSANGQHIVIVALCSVEIEARDKARLKELTAAILLKDDPTLEETGRSIRDTLHKLPRTRVRGTL